MTRKNFDNEVPILAVAPDSDPAKLYLDKIKDSRHAFWNNYRTDVNIFAREAVSGTNAESIE